MRFAGAAGGQWTTAKPSAPRAGIFSGGWLTLLAARVPSTDRKMPEITVATQPALVTGAANWRRVTKAESAYGGFFYTLECSLQFYFSRKITSWPCAWCGPSKDCQWRRKSMGATSKQE